MRIRICGKNSCFDSSLRPPPLRWLLVWYPQPYREWWRFPVKMRVRISGSIQALGSKSLKRTSIVEMRTPEDLPGRVAADVAEWVEYRKLAASGQDLLAQCKDLFPLGLRTLDVFSSV